MTRRRAQSSRPWLTAKGYRALGYPIPAHIRDDEFILLEVKT